MYIFAGKWFCGFSLIKLIARNLLKELHRWYSGISSPYERVFSKQNKLVRYLGIEKNQFSAFMEAICFNLMD